MFSVRRLILNETLRLIMMGVFFIVFTAFGITLIVKAETIQTKILFIVFLGFFAFFFLISEILKFIYKRGMQKLTFHVNPEAAYKTFTTLEKYDIIKGYKNVIYVFKTLYYRDIGDFESLKQTIENPIFQTSSSLKLLFLINSFYLAIEANNEKEVRKLYNEIFKEYTEKKKRRFRPALVYNFDQLCADYFVYLKNPNKARPHLNNINPDILNNREKTYYYITYAKMNYLRNKSSDFHFYNKAKEIKELYHVKEFGEKYEKNA